MSSEHKYNESEGPTFNSGVGKSADFQDITPQDRQQAQDAVDALIQKTRETLGE